MKTFHFLAALPLAIAAPAPAQVMPVGEYVATAGASDLYERRSSRIVLQSTNDPKVRAFATMMVNDHARSTDDVKAAAARARVRAAPPMLNPAQTEMIAQLRAEHGAARDSAYLAQQKAAHGQALAVHEAYAKDGTVAPLKMAAAKIAPVVKHHIEMLKEM